MNKVFVGEVYKVANRKLASDASWELITTTNDAGKDEITLWLAKKQIPSDLVIGDRFRVDKICGYTQKNRPIKGKNGEVTWLPNNSLEVEVEKIVPLDVDGHFFEADGIGGENPFASSESATFGNPFEVIDPDELPF